MYLRCAHSSAIELGSDFQLNLNEGTLTSSRGQPKVTFQPNLSQIKSVTA